MSFLDALLKPIQGALAGQPSVTPAPQGAATPPQEMGGNVVDQASDDSINEDTELQGELLKIGRAHGSIRPRQPSVTPAPQGAATPPQEMGGNVVDQASDDSINEDTELQGELL